jgi:hypothetical protein
MSDDIEQDLIPYRLARDISMLADELSYFNGDKPDHKIDFSYAASVEVLERIKTQLELMVEVRKIKIEQSTAE